MKKVNFIVISSKQSKLNTKLDDICWLITVLIALSTPCAFFILALYFNNR